MKTDSFHTQGAGSPKHERAASSTQHASRPKIARAGQSRCLSLLGERRHTLLEGACTGGGLALSRSEFTRGSGALAHLHSHEDELFLVQSGEFELRIGSRTHDLRAGDFVFAPRGVPHAYTCRSESGALFAGLSRAGFEQFFDDLASQDAASEREMQDLALSRYGVRFGPIESLHELKLVAAPKIVRPKDGERIERRGESVRLMLGSDEAAGALCVAESESAPLRGTGERTHENFDVAFLVRAGIYEFCLGDARVQAAAGDVVWIPRGTAHSFRVVSPEPGRVLMISLPGGLDRFLRHDSLAQD